MILPTTSKIGKQMLLFVVLLGGKKKTLCVQNVWFWLSASARRRKRERTQNRCNRWCVWLLENVREGSNSTTNRKNNNISCSRLHTHSLCHTGRCTSANIGPQTHIITDRHINWSLVALFVGLVAAVFFFSNYKRSQCETKSSLWSSR